MSLKILADENIPAAEHYFAGIGEVSRVAGRDLERSQLNGIDVLLVRSVTRVNEELLADSAVRFVGTATSGVDHVDLDYLRDNGIGFAHAPGSNANSVVEYVLSAIAAVDTQLERLLAGGRVGVVGYGVIGKAVVKRLQGLAIDYCVYDPWLAPELVSQAASLEDVLSCEVVTLHPELTRQQPWPSHHLLSQAQLQLLDPSALLINASRGPVIDNASLLEHLRGGSGPDVVLDVWEGEPVIDVALLEQVRLGSAHIAGYSLDGKLLATQMLRNALSAQLGLDVVESSSAAAPPDAISIGAGLHGASLVRHLLQSRYSILEDDRLLRQAVIGVQPDAAGAGFDRLRKHYAVRRELAGSDVSGELHAAIDRRLLQGLGCSLVTGAGHP